MFLTSSPVQFGLIYKKPVTRSKPSEAKAVEQLIQDLKTASPRKEVAWTYNAASDHVLLYTDQDAQALDNARKPQRDLASTYLTLTEGLPEEQTLNLASHKEALSDRAIAFFWDFVNQTEPNAQLTTRFKNEFEELNPGRADRASMRVVREFLTDFAEKLKQNSPTDIQEVAAKWSGEIGYHCDYTQTFEFKLGDETYRLSKTGYKGSPSTMSYDLERVGVDEGQELTFNLYQDFVVHRSQNGQFMVSVNPRQGGWNGEQGGLLTEQKQPILNRSRRLMKAIEKAIADPFSA